MTEVAMMNLWVYITILLTAVIVVGFCSPEDTYYIEALPNTTCPSRLACMTLSEFTHQDSTPTKNKTLKFLPGEHILSSNMSVANITSCSLLGINKIQNATSRIRCESDVGFTFSNILYVRISSLVFTSCGMHRVVGMESVIHDPPVVVTQIFAVYMDSVLQIEIINSSFKDHTGSALGVNNSRLLLNGNNNFLRNCRHCLSIRNCSCQGGGVYATNSHLNFSRNTSFIRNMAVNGGGMFMKSSTLDATGTIIFRKNFVYQGFGGGIYAESSSLHLCGDVILERNSAGFHGGGVYANNIHLYFCDESSTLFQGNSANMEGGGVKLYGVMIVDGDIIFKDNTAGEGGGICTDHSSLFLTKNTILKNNSAAYGGGIKAVRSTLMLSGNNTLANNSASFRGGGIYANKKTTLILSGVSTFVNNTARSSGGGILLYHSTITSNGTGNISFNGNFANYSGGGICAEFSLINFSGILTVYRNRAQIYGGGIFAKLSTLTFSAGIISANVADLLGGGAYVDESNLNLFGNTFRSNFAVLYGGGIYSQNTSVSLTGNNLFISNSAGTNGGAVYSYVSSLNFSSTNTTFRNNLSVKGGGLYLGSKSICFLISGTRVFMSNNTAVRHGGAIYVEDTSSYIHCFPDEFRGRAVQDNIDGSYGCFFQRSFNSRNVQVTFESNSAQEAGSALYGGSIDNCQQNDPAYYQSFVNIPSGMVFNITFVFVQNTSRELSAISSYPFGVCPCKNNHPDCKTSIVKHQIYPGEKLIVPVVAVGQRNGTAPAIIRSYVQSGDTLGELQEYQSVYPHCTNLVYTLPWSLALRAEILLYVEGPCSMENNPLTISLEMLHCPIGFSLSNERMCECEPKLQVYTNNCNITERSIQHKGGFWVGYSNESGGLILHPYCPFDYCKLGRYTFTFNETDKQCENNRSGLLCGRCEQGLSLTFATSQCSVCSDTNVLLLIVFALAGLALVFFLLLFKITVASGTLNGLILYANIFSLNRDSLLSTNSSSFLTVFIAWLNLDFGIPLCFYNGMDAYARTWLQFVFPIYLWIIIGLIILLTNVSQRVAKVFGTNPVSVLATLFLLSYAKILRTFTASVSLTFLEYPTQQKPVWLHDANIGYLQGEHIPLFLVAVSMFLIFYLPYTILLLLGQCFQAKSHFWMFRWINSSRLNAIRDTYYAPYKPKHRYWTGLILMIRSIMFLTLGFNPHSDPSIDLLLIMLTALGIQSWAWLVGGVYKNWWLEVLETSFILNLGVLAAVTYSIKLEESRVGASLNQGNIAAYISLSLAFVTAIGIFVYHIFSQIWNTRPCKICCSFVSKKTKSLVNYRNSKVLSTHQSQQNNSLLDSSPSHIPLRESLLDDSYTP